MNASLWHRRKPETGCDTGDEVQVGCDPCKTRVAPEPGVYNESTLTIPLNFHQRWPRPRRHPSNLQQLHVTNFMPPALSSLSSLSWHMVLVIKWSIQSVRQCPHQRNKSSYTHIFPQNRLQIIRFLHIRRVIDKFTARGRRSQVLENLTHLFCSIFPSYIYTTCTSSSMINYFYYLGLFSSLTLYLPV